MKKTNRISGFTLIELMVVVTIIGILVAIAYPSYMKNMQKSRRASAEAHLMDIAQRQQQYLLDARAYAIDPNAVATLGLTTPADVAAAYNITVPGSNAPGAPPTFTATATPIVGSAQEDDLCGVLSIDNTGSKVAMKSSVPVQGCW